LILMIIGAKIRCLMQKKTKINEYVSGAMK